MPGYLQLQQIFGSDTNQLPIDLPCLVCGITTDLEIVTKCYLFIRGHNIEF